MTKPNMNPFVLAGLGGGFLILILFYFMDYSPHKKKILSLQGKKKHLTQEVLKARGVARRRKEAERMYKVVQMQWEEANRMIPPKENITSILKSLTTKGGETRVKITYFKPGKTKREKDYTERIISIGMEGGYHQIARFLADVNNLPRVVNVDNLSITRASSGVLEATMDAIIYTSAGSGKPKPKKGGRR